MTRFKELRRIEIALEHGNEAELQWALAYCQMRIKVAAKVYTMIKQEKYWHQMDGKVRSALEGQKSQTD
jgi:hypothetical protein